MVDLLRFFAFYVKVWPCGCNNNFKFDNGGGLLSSVLLFLKYFSFIKKMFLNS